MAANKNQVFSFGGRKYTYAPVAEEQVPESIRFDVWRQEPGAVVQRAFGTLGPGEADVGDPFLMVTDRSVSGAKPEFYRLKGAR